MGGDSCNPPLAHGVCGNGPSAAAGESPADRIPWGPLSVLYLGPHRGIQPGTARAWLRGGEKHSHRVAICGGKIREASRRRADGVLALNSPVLNSQRPQLADLAAKYRLPAMYGQPEYVESG